MLACPPQIQHGIQLPILGHSARKFWFGFKKSFRVSINKSIEEKKTIIVKPIDPSFRSKSQIPRLVFRDIII